MKHKEKSRLNILIDVLKENYSDYYKKHIGHDFLYHIEDYENSDSIAYLMEHVRKLNPKDTEYPNYLKHCYVIYLELQHLVRTEFAESEDNHLSLIRRSLTRKSIEHLLLLDLAIHDSAKMDEFCKEVKSDKTEFLSEVILNLVDSYKDFKKEEFRKSSDLKSYIEYFSKSLSSLTE